MGQNRGKIEVTMSNKEGTPWMLAAVIYPDEVVCARRSGWTRCKNADTFFSAKHYLEEEDHDRTI